MEIMELPLKRIIFTTRVYEDFMWDIEIHESCLSIDAEKMDELKKAMGVVVDILSDRKYKN